jgi:hypothetical protein
MLAPQARSLVAPAGFFIASDRTKNAALAVRADIPWDRRA